MLARLERPANWTIVAYTALAGVMTFALPIVTSDAVSAPFLAVAIVLAVWVGIKSLFSP